MARGIEGGKIFINTKDRNDFIARLGHLAEERSMDVYAWALLENHFHILCKTGTRPLSSSMASYYLGITNSCVTRAVSGGIAHQMDPEQDEEEKNAAGNSQIALKGGLNRMNHYNLLL
jgi:REP element-mobilizing transposase RayT